MTTARLGVGPIVLVCLFAAACGGRAEVNSEVRGKGELSPLPLDPELSASDREETSEDGALAGLAPAGVTPPSASPGTATAGAVAPGAPGADASSTVAAGSTSAPSADASSTVVNGSTPAPGSTTTVSGGEVIMGAPAQPATVDPATGIAGVATPSEPQPMTTAPAPTTGVAGDPLLVPPWPGLPVGSSEPGPLPPPNEGTDLTPVLASIEESEQAVSEQLCKCEYQDFPETPELEDCVLWRFGSNEPPPVTECIHDILKSTSAGDAALECRLQAQFDLQACLDNVGCDLERTWRCEARYYEDTTECPYFPYDLEAKIEIECWGNVVSAPVLCEDGMRLQLYRVCDRIQDCASGEDEAADRCGQTTISDLPSRPEGGYTVCPDGSGYYGPWALCDGWNACVDGTDELAKNCIEAGIDVFECESGDGIPVAWRCDGVPDCDDDESLCR